MRRLWKLKDERTQEKDLLDDLEPETDDQDEGIEMVGADLSDAYCHFGVAADELKNCLAPALEEDEILVLCAMLFGFKGAPLIMGRLSAALARLWQSMIMRDGELQLYMDDPLFALIGPKSRRRGVLAMLLYTAAAMGIQLAFHKGERGLRVCWIGVQLEIATSRALLLLTVPEKVVNELLAKMKEGKRDDTLSQLEINHAGAETTRAATRPDKRSKVRLVPVKRIELPRSSCRSRSCGWSARSPLMKQQPEFLVVADASPWGVGAVLAGRAGELFGGAVRRVGLARALELRGTVVLIRSDSVVALAMVKKLAASSPALNYLGACPAWNLEVSGICRPRRTPSRRSPQH